MKKLLLFIFVTACMAVHSQCVTKPVHLIVAIAPGGGFETLSRDFAEQLSAKYNVPFIIENRPGAEGAVGLSAVLASRPDGTTFLSMPDFVTTKPVTVGGAVINIEDIAPVAGLVQNTDLVLMASPTFAPNTVKEILEYAHRNPGKLTYSTNGDGSVFHVYTEAYLRRQGIDAIHVPFKGLSAANFATMSGDVNLTYNGVKVATELVKSNRLKAIAIVGDHRVSDFPNVPTLKEAGAEELKFNNKLALFAPPGTPPEITQCLANDILKIQQDAGFVEDKMKPFRYVPYIANNSKLAHDLIAEKTKTQRIAK